MNAALPKIYTFFTCILKIAFQKSRHITVIYKIISYMYILTTELDSYTKPDLGLDVVSDLCVQDVHRDVS